MEVVTDEKFWKRLICFSPDTSHCLLSCCVYAPLLSHTQTAKCFSGFLRSRLASRHVCGIPVFLSRNKSPAGRVCWRGSLGDALPLAPSPTTQVSPDLWATRWLCLQPERRPRERFPRSRRVHRDWKVLLCVLRGRTKHGERWALTNPHFWERLPGLWSNTVSVVPD